MLRGNTKRKTRGWVPYGYKYLGPGNSINQGSPTNPSDKAALKHDIAYGRITRTGKNPKFNYNQADEDFLQDTKDAEDWGGKVAHQIFKGKKRLAERGWLSDISPQRHKVIRLRPHKSIASRTLAHRPIEQQTTRNAMPEHAGGQGSGNDAGLKETPIDEVTQVHRGPPEYTFSSLPWLYETKNSGNMWVQNHAFRMTSPYCPLVAGASGVDLNIGAGTMNVYPVTTNDSFTNASTDPNARWFQYYSQLYNYYHVVSARWHIMVENQATEGLWVHQLYTNMSQPPAQATNMDMMLWNDTKSHYLGPVANAITATGFTEDNGVPLGENVETGAATNMTPNFEASNMVAAKGPSPILMMSGEYRPGDFTREIKLDASVENWTSTAANPILSERLLLRIRPEINVVNTNSALDVQRTLQYKLTAKIEYLVEFKELKDGLKWPVQQQPISITINQSSSAL